MIRPVKEQDALELFKLIDNNRNRLREWLPWLDGTKTANDTLDFIKFAIKEMDRKARYDSVIMQGENIVGMIGFNYINHTHKFGSIGYWIDEQYSGRGIVKSACIELIEYGFYKINLNRVEIRACSLNKASCNVARNAGLKFIGTIPDAEWLYDHFVDNSIFSLTKSEYINKKSAQQVDAPEPASPAR